MELKYEGKFDAAHWIPGYGGPCANLHGHTWKVLFHVVGEKDTKTGMLVDFGELKELINRYDHASLNDFFELPTAENIAERLADDALELNDRIRWVRVIVWESEKASVTVVTSAAERKRCW